ncbi:hypothetical protein D3C80_2142260 [compost metagenome]
MGPPRLMLMIWAPLSVAHWMPSMIEPRSPPPFSPSTLMGMILAPGATPATPWRLLVTAAMTPAT